MSQRDRIRARRILREAEGFLELHLPDSALKALDRLGESHQFRGQACYLRGDALRQLERYTEAVPLLMAAAELAPSNMHVWTALGWCYKRINQLPAAIDALERAVEAHPDSALARYNLACYLSLAGEKRRTFDLLEVALDLDPQYRDLMQGEADFDNVRSDPEFQALLGLSV